MCHNDQYELALSFWRVSLQYLSIVENIARETEVQGNTLVLTKDIKDGPITPEEYKEKTMWSDHNVIVPLLFNLYHGIELLVKGFLLIDASTDVKPRHTVQELSRQFAKLFPGEDVLIGFVQKYTEEAHLPNILAEFITDNAMTFKDLYQALRYPTDTDFQKLNRYLKLKYQGENGIRFFTELHQDVQTARIAAVMLGRSLEPKKEDGQQADRH